MKRYHLFAMWFIVVVVVKLHFVFLFSIFFLSLSPDKTISKLRGHTVTLECPIDVQSCGNLHSLKWFKGSDRVAVVSGDGSLTNVEGPYSGR